VVDNRPGAHRETIRIPCWIGPTICNLVDTITPGLRERLADGKVIWAKRAATAATIFSARKT